MDLLFKLLLQITTRLFTSGYQLSLKSDSLEIWLILSGKLVQILRCYFYA